MTKRIEYPFTLEKIRELRVGDRVRVSGRVFTARDRVHRHLMDGAKPPVDLKDGAIYHCGPVVLRGDKGWIVKAAGPTTSLREEPYTAKLIEQHQIRVIIGKGGMGEATRAACAARGCVYLQAPGGAAVLLAQRIERVAAAYLLNEFGPTEAMWEFIVKDLEAIVTMDARGRSLHHRIQTASRRALKALLAQAPR
jgi:fumarate hydratase class I